MITGNVGGGRPPPGQWTCVTPVHCVESHSTKGIRVVREEIDKDSNDVQAREHLARNLVRYAKEISAQKKGSFGQKKCQSSTMSES